MIKVILTILCLLSATTTLGSDRPNIILMIGDGMGPAYTTAYRYFQNSSGTSKFDRTIFDATLVGTASTYPDDIDGAVTDSAAAATAIASGVKTYNGAIGVDKDKNPLKTLLDLAKENGYRTAIVATSSITHATPASFVAHVDSRLKNFEIANQYVDEQFAGKPKVDLLMGGGRKYFRRDDRNLLDEFKAAGYSIADNMQELQSLTSLPEIALVNENSLPFALDSQDVTRLATMTQKALTLLGEGPFFLLVEASQIDWCGHANDIVCAMAEMHDFARTIEQTVHFVDSRPNTLMVVTADHSTGGLSLGANQKDRWSPDVIRKVSASSMKIVQRQVEKGESWESEWGSITGISLAQKERDRFQIIFLQLDDLNSSTVGDKQEGFRISFEQLMECTELAAVPGGSCSLLLALHALSIEAINDRSYTGWTTRGHTAIDVQVFSYGKNAQQFQGSMDNTDIAKKLSRVILSPSDLSSSGEL